MKWYGYFGMGFVAAALMGLIAFQPFTWFDFLFGTILCGLGFALIGQANKDEKKGK